MKFIVLLISVLILHAAAISCPAYKCEPTLTDKTCASKAEDVVKLKVCSGKNEYCPIPANVGDETTCTNTSTGLLPGDYCTAATQCASAKCSTSNVCVGAAESITCKFDSECDVGLYCDGTNCVKTALFGKPCSDSIKCDPAAICYNSVCTARAQLANGAASTVPALCQSYYVDGDKCVKGPTYAGKGRDCPADGFCNYNLNATTVKAACVCGMSEKTAGYCALGHGDVPLKDVLFYPV